MRDDQRKHFSVRAEHDNHQALILNTETGNDAERYFRQLTGRVFHHHIVSIPILSEPQWPDHYADNSLPPRECISYLFHTKHYCPVNVSMGIHGSVIAFDRFISDITRISEDKSENNVRYLVGDIGFGKSSFVSNIIVNYGKEWVEDKNLIPIRVDLDVEADHLFIHAHEIITQLYEKILEAFRSLAIVPEDKLTEVILESNIPHMKNAKDVLLVDLEARFANFIKMLTKVSEKRILLIIDNLDFLYHLYDRGLFTLNFSSFHPPTDEQKQLLESTEDAHRMIQYLVKVFLESRSLAKAGINVLIVLRKDSLIHYMTATRVEVPPQFDPRLHTYHISVPPLETVYSSHVELLIETIRRLPDTPVKETYLSATESLMMSPYETVQRKRLLQDMMCLARQGLRDIIMHYSGFVWLPIGINQTGEHHMIIQRFQDQYAPSLIAYILGANRLFSQFTSKFPNMYLVRSDCFQERDVPWGHLLSQHRHTYWLKRLILSFVAGMESQGELVTPKVITDLFSEYDDDRLCYEESIVRLVLGSLSQTESSSVFNLEFVPSENRGSHVIKSLRLTNRGWLLANRFSDTFIYLQLITDDHLLPIPSCVADEFQYTNLDYGYLVERRDPYKQHLKSILRRKVRQVMIFLEVLRVSLEYEKNVFSCVFERLEQNRITIPDIDKIEGQIRSELQEILRHQHFVVEDCIPTTKQHEVQEMLREELRNVYIRNE